MSTPNFRTSVPPPPPTPNGGGKNSGGKPSGPKKQSNSSSNQTGQKTNALEAQEINALKAEIANLTNMMKQFAQNQQSGTSQVVQIQPTSTVSAGSVQSLIAQARSKPRSTSAPSNGTVSAGPAQSVIQQARAHVSDITNFQVTTRTHPFFENNVNLNAEIQKIAGELQTKFQVTTRTHPFFENNVNLNAEIQKIAGELQTKFRLDHNMVAEILTSPLKTKPGTLSIVTLSKRTHLLTIWESLIRQSAPVDIASVVIILCVGLHPDNDRGFLVNFITLSQLTLDSLDAYATAFASVQAKLDMLRDVLKNAIDHYRTVLNNHRAIQISNSKDPSTAPFVKVNGIDVPFDYADLDELVDVLIDKFILKTI